MRASTKTKLWRRGFFILAVSVFIFLAAGSIYDYQDTILEPLSELPTIDAIVCLGGGRGRVTRAGDIWFRYAIENRKPLLYFSGMGSQFHWGSLVKQIRPEVLVLLEAKDVFIERESINTEGNAIWSVKYALEKNWQRILLLTSTYHMKRAHYLFKETFARHHRSIQIETLSAYQEPFSPRAWYLDLNGIRVTFTEFTKWLYYRFIWKPIYQGPSFSG